VPWNPHACTLTEVLRTRAAAVRSLDVEGAEYEVLKTFDFERVSVDVIVLEGRNDDKKKDAMARELLKQKGFKLYINHINNNWFHRQGWRPSANPKPDGAFWRPENSSDVAPEYLRGRTSSTKYPAG
jgi:hypothetical protein